MPDMIELDQKIQKADVAYDGQLFDEAVRLCDQILQDAPRDSEQATQADTLRRHASEAALLIEIANSGEAEQAIDLLNRAIGEKKLVFDIKRRPLIDALRQFESRRTAAADLQAQNYLKAGDACKAEGDLEKALEDYRAAGQVPFSSPEVAGLTQERIHEIETSRAIQEQFEFQVGEARRMQAETRYEAALDKIKDALAAGGGLIRLSEDESELFRTLEKQAELARRIVVLRGQAREERENKQFGQALSLLYTVAQFAQDLNLVSLAEEIQKDQDDLESYLEAEQTQAQALYSRAQDAVKARNLPEALKLLERARYQSQNVAEIDSLYLDILLASDRLNRVQEIKNRAQQQKNPFEKRRILQEARSLVKQTDLLINYFSKDGEMIDELIADAEKAGALVAISQTIAEGGLVLDTPAGFEKSVAEKIQEMKQKGIDTVYVSEWAETARAMFIRIASFKIQEQVDTEKVDKGVKPLIQAGKFDEAARKLEETITEWTSMGWISPTQLVLYRDKSPYAKLQNMIEENKASITRRIPRSALGARLEIYQALTACLYRAAEVQAQVDGERNAGAQAWQQEKFSIALEHSQEAIGIIESQEDSGTRCVMEGVRNSLKTELARKLHEWGKLLDNDVLMKSKDAERLLLAGDVDEDSLDPAREYALSALQDAKTLAGARQRYEAFTSEVQRRIWNYQERLAGAEYLFSQTERYLRYRSALQEGETALNEGAYERAGERFRSISEDPDVPDGARDHWGYKAQSYLDSLEILAPLKATYNERIDAQDYQSALEALRKIAAYDGHSQWTEETLRDLTVKAEGQRRASLSIELARNAYQRRDFASALEEVVKALDEMPGLLEPELLRKEIEHKIQMQGEVAAARLEMRGAFERGQRRSDYETAYDKAGFILEDNPGDQEAKRFQGDASEILAVGERVEESEDPVSLSPDIERLCRRYAQSEYLSQFNKEVQQKLTSKVTYESLWADIRQALKQKDWSVALRLGAAAQRNYPKEKELTEAVKLARDSLVKIIKENLVSPTDENHYLAASEAAASIRMAMGEEALDQGLRDALDRTRRVLEARRNIQQKLYAEAYQTLEPIREQIVGDDQLGLLLREAEFGAQMNAGRSAQRNGDFESALAAFSRASTIIPADAEAQRLMERSRIEAAVQCCDRALREGDHDQAQLVLQDVPETDQEDLRIKERRILVNHVSLHLFNADQAYKQGKLDSALEEIAALLKQRNGYPPAIKLRADILGDALTLAQDAEAKKDFGQALYLYRLAREYGGDEMRSKVVEGENNVDNAIVVKFNDAIRRADNAIANPDLGEGERATLEAELHELHRMDDKRQSALILMRINTLRECQRPIAEIEENIARAKREMDAALTAETQESADRHFQDAKNYLEKGRGINRYNERSSLRILLEQYSSHQRRRADARIKMQEYERTLKEIEVIELQSGSLPSAAEELTIAQIEKFEKDRQSLFERALKLSADIRSLDADNTYLTRNWPEKPQVEKDPLVVKDKELAAHWESITFLAYQLKLAIQDRKKAFERVELADRAYKNATKDDDLGDAVKEFEKGAGLLKDVEKNMLQAKGQISSNLPHSRHLHHFCPSFSDLCHAEHEDIMRMRQAVQDTMENIKPLREQARHYYGLANHDHRSARPALEYYEQILALNKNDQEALSRRIELQKKDREYQQRRARNKKILLALAGMIIFCGLLTVAGILWRPGGVANPHTVTPTATITLTPTVTLTNTPTVIPPSYTPTSTLIPSATFTLTPSPLPYTLCTLADNAWLREKPGGTGLGQFARGQVVEVVGKKKDEDGKEWFAVNNPGRTPPIVYIDAALFSLDCTGQMNQ